MQSGPSELLHTEQIEALFEFGSLGQKEFEIAHQVISSLQPDATRLDLLRALRMTLGESIDGAVIGRLVDSLIYLAAMQVGSGWSSESLVPSLREAQEDPRLERWATADSRTVASRLAALLGEASIRSLAKQTDVAMEQSRLFRSCRIFVELRPIYGADVDTAPQRFVISHLLKIQYSEGGIWKDFYVSLTASDLKNMEHHLARERSKLSSLTRVIHDAGGTIVDVSTPFHQEDAGSTEDE